MTVELPPDFVHAVTERTWHQGENDGRVIATINALLDAHGAECCGGHLYSGSTETAVRNLRAEYGREGDGTEFDAKDLDYLLTQVETVTATTWE